MLRGDTGPPCHLCDLCDTIKAMIRQVELDCVNFLKAMMLIQTSPLLRGLKVARQTGLS